MPHAAGEHVNVGRSARPRRRALRHPRRVGPRLPAAPRPGPPDTRRRRQAAGANGLAVRPAALSGPPGRLSRDP
eukprot:2699795-Pyramimonas_sp.AAC.2